MKWVTFLQVLNVFTSLEIVSTCRSHPASKTSVFQYCPIVMFCDCISLYKQQRHCTWAKYLRASQPWCGVGGERIAHKAFFILASTLIVTLLRLTDILRKIQKIGYPTHPGGQGGGGDFIVNIPLKTQLVTNCRKKIFSVLLLCGNYRLGMFEFMALRTIFWSKRNGVTQRWRKFHSEELYNLYSSTNIITMMKHIRHGWGNETCMYNFSLETSR